MSLHGILGPCTFFFCHAPSFTHRFVTHHLSLTTLTHAIFHTKLCHIHHFLRPTPSFTYHFVTHNSSHTTCFTSGSSTTSFVFPSFPVPATTYVTHYWKKLTCGVILSFNFVYGRSVQTLGLSPNTHTRAHWLRSHSFCADFPTQVGCSFWLRLIRLWFPERLSIATAQDTKSKQSKQSKPNVQISKMQAKNMNRTPKRPAEFEAVSFRL